MHLRTRFSPILIAVTILACGVGAATFVLAWTGPTSAPPNGNVAAPINVSSTSQIKNGPLGVDTLAVYGNGQVVGTLTLDDELCLGDECRSTWPSFSEDDINLAVSHNNCIWVAQSGSNAQCPADRYVAAVSVSGSTYQDPWGGNTSFSVSASVRCCRPHQ